MTPEERARYERKLEVKSDVIVRLLACLVAGECDMVRLPDGWCIRIDRCASPQTSATPEEER